MRSRCGSRSSSRGSPAGRRGRGQVVGPVGHYGDEPGVTRASAGQDNQVSPASGIEGRAAVISSRRRVLIASASAFSAYAYSSHRCDSTASRT